MPSQFLEQLRPVCAFLNVVLHITVYVLVIPYVPWYLQPVWLICELPLSGAKAFN
jgi:hypothetical protein